MPQQERWPSPHSLLGVSGWPCTHPAFPPWPADFLGGGARPGPCGEGHVPASRHTSQGAGGKLASWPCPLPPRQLGLSWPPHSPTHPSPGRSWTPRRPGTRRPRRHPGRPGRELSGGGRAGRASRPAGRLTAAPGFKGGLSPLRTGGLPAGAAQGQQPPGGRGSLSGQVPWPTDSVFRGRQPEAAPVTWPASARTRAE